MMFQGTEVAIPAATQWKIPYHPLGESALNDR